MAAGRENSSRCVLAGGTHTAIVGGKSTTVLSVKSLMEPATA
jgi:hypothetical protein